MVEPQDTSLEEISSRFMGRIRRWERRGDKSVIFFMEDGAAYRVNNVLVTERAAHVTFRSQNGFRLVIPQSLARLKQRAWYSILPALLGLLASLTAGFLSVADFWGDDSDEIKRRINELRDMRESLSALSQYVEEQEGELSRIGRAIESKELEKKNLEAILSMDKAEVDALLQHWRKRSSLEKWSERLIAFLIGVFSSLMGAFCWAYWQNVRSFRQQKEAAYEE